MLLFRLKKEFDDQAGEYFSVIVPKYVLRKLEWEFVENGMNDVYVCIDNGQCIWGSSQRQGSKSADAAVWNDLNQKGACYECKLDRAIKRNQIDLLSCIWHKSNHAVVASFGAYAVVKKHLLDFEVPNSLKIVGRDSMFEFWTL